VETGEKMNDIAIDYVKKLFGKEVKLDDPLAEETRKLERQVDFEQRILENKIKLKTLKSISDYDLDRAFEDGGINEYVQSLMKLKVANHVKANAWKIVDEALDDLENDYGLTTSIRQSVIKKIKDAF